MIRTGCIVLLAAFSVASTTSDVRSQSDRARLQREQAGILRKAERLRDLMQRLLSRYEREGRTEQVKLLQEGLQHLRDANLIEDVAGIRNDLQNSALTEASRKQVEVLEDLERLLNILMDRQSIENLDREIEASAEMAADAAELLRQQTELQEKTREATEGDANQTERELSEMLSRLAQQQAEESQRNSRQAGLRMPFLENALQRVQNLLRRQQKLEETAQRELTADPDRPDPRQQATFAIGELQQQQRELMTARTRQRDLELTRRAAEELQAAVERDDEGLREAISKLASRLDSSVRRGADDAAGTLDKLREQAAAATPEQSQREQLEQLAKQVQEFADERGAALDESADAQQKALTEALSQQAEQLAGDKKAEKGSPSESLERAASALEKAAEQAEAGKDREAMDSRAEAGRQIAQANERQRNQNPDAEQLASEMASESAQVAQTLRRAPETGPEGESAEERASEQMDRAEQALRRAADGLAAQQRENNGADLAKAGTKEAREALEQARKELQQALDQAMDAEEGSLRKATEQAAARQEELRKQAEQLAQQLQQGQASGQLSPEQSQGAQKEMQRAQQAMQQAQQSLQKGQQATASQRQQAAAESLEKANEALQRNRPLNEEQRQQLNELAKEQEKLEEDIIQLAKLAEERRNQRAQQALEQAAQSAQKASKAMEQGDQQEADQQQEEAREQLQQAQDALEEERDRYMDLRQEELLFRIRDELTQFLEKQREITAATKEAADSLADGRRLTRPMRRKLNTLGERERELGAKATYLRTSLEEEGTLVFTHALKANEEDLADVAQRLGNRQPDPGEFTALLQQAVEDRTTQLIEALKKEQQRREQEQKEQGGGQQNDPGQNRDARPRLVPVVAELKMLKQMEQEMLDRTQRIEQLLAAAGGDAVTETETALIERLAHRHNQITQIFLQIKTMIEQALAGPPDGEAEADKAEKGGKGK